MFKDTKPNSDQIDLLIWFPQILTAQVKGPFH